jgi:hypothetical protein
LTTRGGGFGGSALDAGSPAALATTPGEEELQPEAASEATSAQAAMPQRKRFIGNSSSGSDHKKARAAARHGLTKKGQSAGPLAPGLHLHVPAKW